MWNRSFLRPGLSNAMTQPVVRRSSVVPTIQRERNEPHGDRRVVPRSPTAPDRHRPSRRRDRTGRFRPRPCRGRQQRRLNTKPSHTLGSRRAPRDVPISISVRTRSTSRTVAVLLPRHGPRTPAWHRPGTAASALTCANPEPWHTTTVLRLCPPLKMVVRRAKPDLRCNNYFERRSRQLFKMVVVNTRVSLAGSPDGVAGLPSRRDHDRPRPRPWTRWRRGADRHTHNARVPNPDNYLERVAGNAAT